ncbi:unnamed protein product [Strongylus vulgaris]|uniref:Uncharacterized protein n=1 Tax=Strongylus vulgaris TaxID=40348 RepID=A0A3P7JZQ1_STRVU|nr:unnamed protein product [Strongylus vulgaris]
MGLRLRLNNARARLDTLELHVRTALQDMRDPVMDLILEPAYLSSKDSPNALVLALFLSTQLEEDVSARHMLKDQTAINAHRTLSTWQLRTLKDVFHASAPESHNNASLQASADRWLGSFPAQLRFT